MFPCTFCGAEVDADPHEDWVCAECGEIHLGPPTFPVLPDQADDAERTGDAEQAEAPTNPETPGGPGAGPAPVAKRPHASSHP